RLRFLSTALSSCASALLPLLSFPTRRSSDLTLWLLPFLESPLRDDGYDTADYFKVLPVHGDLDDFKAFLDEAHERGMRVITELVLNHTSDQHPWFQQARDPSSPKHDWYVWSETADRYRGVRIIFTDTEVSNWSWD